MFQFGFYEFHIWSSENWKKYTLTSRFRWMKTEPLGKCGCYSALYLKILTPSVQLGIHYNIKVIFELEPKLLPSCTHILPPYTHLLFLVSFSSPPLAYKIVVCFSSFKDGNKLRNLGIHWFFFTTLNSLALWIDFLYLCTPRHFLLSREFIQLLLECIDFFHNFE